MNKATRAALGDFAANQRGLFSVMQAKHVGVSNAQLLRAEAAGQLRRVRRGVYATPGIPPSPWEQIVSATLAAGPTLSSLTPVRRQCTGSNTAVPAP